MSMSLQSCRERQVLCVHASRRAMAFVLYLLAGIALAIACTRAGRAAGAADSAQTPAPGKWHGIVVDVRGKPVEGAQVVASHVVDPAERSDGEFGEFVSDVVRTGPDGSFVLDLRGAERQADLQVVAYKEGAGVAWQNYRAVEAPPQVLLRLAKPAPLQGTVVDAQDKPVAGAEVRAYPVTRRCGESAWAANLPAGWLTIETGADGVFTFRDFPAEAFAWFQITARDYPRILSCQILSHEIQRFQSGQVDNTIRLPALGRIEGRVVEAATGRPIAGVVLKAGSHPMGRVWFNSPPVVSAGDGSFSIEKLPEGEYHLGCPEQADRPADWAFVPVTVKVRGGAATKGVVVKADKGGLVEVSVCDERTGKPVADAPVAAVGFHQMLVTATDAEGIARFRVPLGGKHAVRMVLAHCQDNNYRCEEVKEFPIMVEAGKTTRQEVRLTPKPHLEGVVRGSDGQPLSGVSVAVVPNEGYHNVLTDPAGRFDVNWVPRNRLYVLARLPQRNLVSLTEIKNDTGHKDLSLQPGLILRGRVTSEEGAGIPAARVHVAVRHKKIGGLTQIESLTGEDGRFEVQGIPLEQGQLECAIQLADAEGFGPLGPLNYARVRLTDTPGERVQIPDIVLPRADQSIAGLVVDAQGRPASNCPISVSPADTRPHPDAPPIGDQPPLSSATNEHGRFVINGVCRGPLRVDANVGERWGVRRTHGGDQNIRVVLGDQRDLALSAAATPTVKPLPKMEAFDVRPVPVVAGNKMLVCFWDMEQKPSRRCVETLAVKAGQLEKAGVTVVLVHVPTADRAKVEQAAVQAKATFPLGVVPAGTDNGKALLDSWGAHSLPWLVLADAKGAVRAEGFSVDQLDAKLAELSKK
jgi:hypothetical protein